MKLKRQPVCIMPAERRVSPEPSKVGFIKLFAINRYLVSEICAVSSVSKKDIGKCFKLILKTMETSMEQITSADFMVKSCFRKV